MPYIPHSEKETERMLEALGATSIHQLFDEIPSTFNNKAQTTLQEPINEMQLIRELEALSPSHPLGSCFIGAGAYEHSIPSAVWQLAARGEFYTAYTPYQAEASQGNLQILYEYQTLMSQLMGMDISNASLYEGATALCEAIEMGFRIQKRKNKKAKKVIIPSNIHPHYRATLEVILGSASIISMDSNPSTPLTEALNALDLTDFSDIASLVIPQPTFLGTIESADTLTQWAHDRGLLVIALVNPIAMSILKPPGEWGTHGADIACGEGQPLGIPLSGGGPYFGFLCTRKVHVRELPGRLVGKTKDRRGNEGYTLTLQAREQHIRRGKAKSNICTNQGLMITAATIYMSLMGDQGLQKVAIDSHQKACALYKQLLTIEGIKPATSPPFFHEFAIKVPNNIQAIQNEMAKEGFQSGLALETFYPNLKDHLLICVTETKTTQDCQNYYNALSTIVRRICYADV